MNRSLKIFALFAVVGSLALNAYLLMCRRHEATQRHQQPGAQAQNHYSDEVRKRSFSQLSDQIRQKELQSAAARVDAAEARVKQLLPLGERFEASPQASAVQEARVARLMDHVFPGQRSDYEIECRESVCRLRNVGKISNEYWMQEIQSNAATRGAFARLYFGREGTFVELADESIEAGRKLFRRIFESLDESEAANACKAKSSAVGGLELSLIFHKDQRRIEAKADGSLASDEFGKCVLQVLQDVVEQQPIPSEVDVIPDWPVLVTIP